tara:strand:- start:145 stop:642 length:498 start_codon:yes stop_codon:yes gene_type:complete
MEPDLMEALAAEAKARGAESNKSTVAREILREGLFKKKTRRKTKSKKSQRDEVVPQVYALWDEAAPKGIARPRSMNDRRTAKIMARHAEQPDLGKWKAGIILMFASNRGFYLGKNDRDWKADLEYFVRPDVFAKWTDAAQQFEKAGGDTNEFLLMMKKVKDEQDV